MRLAAFDTRRLNWAVGLAAVAAAGAFLGLTGPFGSYSAGPAFERVLYWTGTLAAGMLVYGTVVRRILRLHLSPGMTFAWLTTAVAVLAAPFGWMVSVVAQAVWPRIEAMSPLDWYGQVLLISMPLAIGPALLARSWSRYGRAATHPASVEGLLGVPARAVLCLQMEDHYVRVHTEDDSRLVLATLGQAIAALGDVPGLRVHRSWWVAKSAVVVAVAHGRNLRLQLANGALAPVARSSVHAVRTAGWTRSDEFAAR